jgi:hypothetical protein
MTYSPFLTVCFARAMHAIEICRQQSIDKTRSTKREIIERRVRTTKLNPPLTGLQCAKYKVLGRQVRQEDTEK